jgi:carbonic anhydrase/acetyltransferase-like protein (isoleucine patch superfamily)
MPGVLRWRAGPCACHAALFWFDDTMLIRHRGHEPIVDSTAYIAPTATLVGRVRVGPRARVMYGAVLDAEDGSIDIGEAVIIGENAVLRGSATVADHVFVGPRATLLACQVERSCYLATGATVLQEAALGEGTVVAINATVHARTTLPKESFIPPGMVALDEQVYAPGDPAMVGAIAGIGFTAVAFGVDPSEGDRISRYERVTEVRSALFRAHHDDEIVS